MLMFILGMLLGPVLLPLAMALGLALLLAFAACVLHYSIKLTGQEPAWRAWVETCRRARQLEAVLQARAEATALEHGARRRSGIRR